MYYCISAPIQSLLSAFVQNATAEKDDDEPPKLFERVADEGPDTKQKDDPAEVSPSVNALKLNNE